MKQYDFLAFSLNTKKHALYQSGKKLSIGTIAFNILHEFVQKPGQVIRKDELLAQVWPDKTVTDATVYKQVQRLRKILGDTAENKTVINTIHGVGFEFLPEVTVSNLSSEVTNNNKPKSVLFVAVCMVVLAYFIMMLIGSEHDQPDSLIISDATAKPITVAMIPSFINGNDYKQDWMANGGVHYLAQTFNEDWVKTKNISKQTLKATDPDQYAIELSLKKSADASIIFNVIENDRQFTSKVKIRDVEGAISEQEFTAISVVNLLDEISVWSKQVLNLESPVKNKNMSQNQFAIENYIRGKSAQLSGDAKTAIKYFELATTEDDGFRLAWYELSISYRKQGDNQKALSIVNSLFETTAEESDKIKLHASKESILFRLGDYDGALKEANLGLELARKFNKKQAISVLLSNRAGIQSALGDFQAAKNSVAESMEISDSLSTGDFRSLAIDYNLLAGIHIRLNQFKQANEYSELAIKYFRLAGNLRDETTARSRQVTILYAMGYIQKAKKISQELLTIRQTLGDIPGQTSSLSWLLSIQILLGEFDQAENTSQQVSDLLDITGNKFQGFLFLADQALLRLGQGKLALANETINQIQDQHYDDSQSFMVKVLKLKYHELNNDQQQWKDLVLEMNQNPDFQNEPLNYVFKAQLAVKENDLQHAQFIFEKAETLAINQEEVISIGQVMNAYIEFSIDNDENLKVQQLIDKLAKYRPLDYPYLKNKARLAHLNGDNFAAITLMKQLKNTANDHWKVEDSLLLEKYQQLQNNKD